MTDKEGGPTDSINLVNFSGEDQTAVYNFCVEIFQELGWPVAYLKGMEDIPSYFDLPKGIFVVAKDTSTIVGCGGVKPLEGSTGIIKRFYIAKQLRGGESAKRLLARIIQESQQKGFTELVLDVHFKNERAEKFYTKNGFERFIPEPNFVWSESKEPDIFHYMRLDISNERDK